MVGVGGTTANRATPTTGTAIRARRISPSSRPRRNRLPAMSEDRHAGAAVLVGPGDLVRLGAQRQGHDGGALLGLDEVQPLRRRMGDPHPAVGQARGDQA
ncbi:hypothetical protein LTR94_035749, partial [Friedmanniomyces endolithicus]